MNGRVYDPELGRFTGVDPFMTSPLNAQTMNPYSYVSNNPIMKTDPTGYCEAATGTHIKKCETAKITATDKETGKTSTRTVRYNSKNPKEMASKFSNAINNVVNAVGGNGAQWAVGGNGAQWMASYNDKMRKANDIQAKQDSRDAPISGGVNGQAAVETGGAEGYNKVKVRNNVYALIPNTISSDIDYVGDINNAIDRDVAAGANWWNDIVGGDTPVHIKYSSDMTQAQYVYQDDGLGLSHVISWNPRSAMVLERKIGERGILGGLSQSPATTLSHEIGHAHLMIFRMAELKSDGTLNATGTRIQSEKMWEWTHATQEYENVIAKHYGEATRKRYSPPITGAGPQVNFREVKCATCTN